MALSLQPLIDEVTRQKTVTAGVLALIAQLKANAGDPVALQALVAQMSDSDTQLADAVTANTTPTP